MSDWLAGRRVSVSGAPGGPAARAGAVLRRLGAEVALAPGPERVGAVEIEGWRGEAAAGLRGRPRGRPGAQYLGLLAALRLLRGGGAVDAAEAAGLMTGQGARPAA